jgi:hypothetical protein
MKEEGYRPEIFEVFDPVDPPPAQRPCAAPGCALEGSYRAPMSRERINEYRWFCLDHVRLYNASWNYYAGLSDAEMEAAIRSDSTWNRPTWPLGKGQGHGQAADDQPHGGFTAGYGPGYGNGRTSTNRSTPFDDLADPFDLLRGQGYGPGPGRRGEAAPPTPLSAAERKAFATLELSYPVTFEELRTQYKKLVKRHHPDTHGGAKDAEERLKRVNAAYRMLKSRFFA